MIKRFFIVWIGALLFVSASLASSAASAQFPGFPGNSPAPLPTISTPAPEPENTAMPEETPRPETSEEPIRVLFPDVPAQFWAFAEITELVEKDLLRGYPDLTFRPQANITRAETAKVLTECIPSAPRSEAGFTFADVSETDWFSEYAYAADALLPPIYNPDGVRIFRGTDPLRREEAVWALVLLYSGGKHPAASEEAILLQYSDAEKIDASFRPYVAAALEMGIITGYADNTLRMAETITRAEFCTMLYRVFSSSFYTKVQENTAKVVAGYDDGRMLGITFEKWGVNGLPDFGYWYFFDKTATDYNFASATPVKEPFTDYFSPYKIKAVSNGNGDYPGSMDFTGGNHGYTSQGANPGKTAENVAFRIFVDGRETTDYSGTARRIDFEIINRIQATNTKKKDGTGRAVLEETIHISFDGEKWNFSITMTALEDIRVIKYYGPQCDLCVFGDTVEYLSPSGQHMSFPADVASRSDGITFNTIQIHGMIDAEISVRPAALSPLCLESDYSAFCENYGKTYFNIIDATKTPMSLNKGETYSVEGYYRFKHLD